MTERFNQTLVTKLIAMVNEDHNDWDEHLGSILSGYRSSKQKSTKVSLFVMMYGCKPRLPIEIELGLVLNFFYKETNELNFKKFRE